jgi:uncharacterized membrane protein YoaK (UPF0700 family)
VTTSIIHDQPAQIPFPLMEQRTVAFLLAFAAGLMNAWTLFHAETFATVQSGNVIQSGYRLVQGDWAAFVFASVSVLAFGLGAALCGILMTNLVRQGRIYTPVVLWFECASLLVAALASQTGMIDAHIVAYIVSFVAGAQGNAFHKTRGMLYGNVAVTFVVQMAFNFLIQSVFSRKGINGEPNLMWSGLFFLVLLGFAIGGAIGFLIDSLTDGVALFLPAAIALILLVIALAERGRPIDPTPGGLIG